MFQDTSMGIEYIHVYDKLWMEFQSTVELLYNMMLFLQNTHKDII